MKKFTLRRLHNILNKIIQTHNGNRNLAAMLCLVELGYEPQDIRQAIFDLNRIKVKELVNGHGISAPTLYNTLRGARANELAKTLLADSVGLEVGQFFPGTGEGRA